MYAVLARAFGEGVISQGLWPAQSLNLDLCDSFTRKYRKVRCVGVMLIHFKELKKVFGWKFLVLCSKLTLLCGY